MLKVLHLVLKDELFCIKCGMLIADMAPSGAFVEDAESYTPERAASLEIVRCCDTAKGNE